MSALPLSYLSSYMTRKENVLPAVTLLTMDKVSMMFNDFVYGSCPLKVLPQQTGLCQNARITESKKGHVVHGISDLVPSSYIKSSTFEVLPHQLQLDGQFFFYITATDDYLYGLIFLTVNNIFFSFKFMHQSDNYVHVTLI